jgi:hypothetical protein
MSPNNECHLSRLPNFCLNTQVGGMVENRGRGKAAIATNQSKNPVAIKKGRLFAVVVLTDN